MQLEVLPFKSFLDKKHYVQSYSSLLFADNEKILISGPSGSGKSTFLKIISGLTKANNLMHSEDSFLYFRNKPVTDFLDFRRNTLSYLNQNLNFINTFNLRENFELEINKPDITIFQNLYNKMNFRNKIDFNSKMNLFSNGEKQRLALIRQLMKPHHLMLLDEPTSNLDSENAELVFNLITNLQKTVLVISHDLRFKEKFDKIISIDEILKFGVISND